MIGNFNPNLSGLWVYKNGFINPSAPTDPTAEGGNFPYPKLPEVMLERFVGTFGSGATTDTQAYSIGSFQINDTFLQVNNPVQFVSDPVIAVSTNEDFDQPRDTIEKISSVTETTRVSWSCLIDGSYPEGSPEVASRLFVGNGFAFESYSSPGLCTPSFELGYQASISFGLFYGFSWFNFDSTVSRSAIVEANFADSDSHTLFPSILRSQPRGETRCLAGPQFCNRARIAFRAVEAVVLLAPLLPRPAVTVIVRLWRLEVVLIAGTSLWELSHLARRSGAEGLSCEAIL